MNNDDLAPRGDPAHDRLGKVRPLIDHLSEKFATLYEPSRDVAVDEAMIKFQGRLSLKQYMPAKPIKRGIKVWVLGDSSNGYFSNYDVYTGRKEDRQVGLGAHVVQTLTEELKNKHHLDNFFTSYQLLEDLEKDGICVASVQMPFRPEREGMTRLIELYLSPCSMSVASSNGSNTSTSSRKTAFS